MCFHTYMYTDTRAYRFRYVCHTCIYIYICMCVCVCVCVGGGGGQLLASMYLQIPLSAASSPCQRLLLLNPACLRTSGKFEAREVRKPGTACYVTRHVSARSRTNNCKEFASNSSPLNITSGPYPRRTSRGEERLAAYPMWTNILRNMKRQAALTASFQKITDQSVEPFVAKARKQ